MNTDPDDPPWTLPPPLPRSPAETPTALSALPPGQRRVTGIPRRPCPPLPSSPPRSLPSRPFPASLPPSPPPLTRIPCPYRSDAGAIRFLGCDYPPPYRHLRPPLRRRPVGRAVPPLHRVDCGQSQSTHHLPPPHHSTPRYLRGRRRPAPASSLPRSRRGKKPAAPSATRSVPALTSPRSTPASPAPISTPSPLLPHQRRRRR